VRPLKTQMEPTSRRGHIQRGAWGLVSQSASTAGNLATAIFVASTSSAAAFGAWSVGYAVALGVLTIVRAVCSTPLILDDAAGESRLIPERGAISSSWWLGSIAGVAVAASSLLTHGHLSQILLVFGISLPILMVQDSLRYLLFARRTPAPAAAMDVIWLVVTIAGFLVLSALHLTGGATATLVWTLGALVSCGYAAARGVIPSLLPSHALAYLRQQRWVSSRLLADSILNSISTQALPVVLALSGGLASAGALRAGQTLFGFIGVVVAGLTPVMTAEAVRDLRSGGSAWRLVLVWSLLLAFLGGLFGSILYTIPDSVGILALGASWAGAIALLLPLTVQAVLRGPLTGVPIVFRARLQLNRALGLRLMTAVPSLALPVVGAIGWQASGAAWGIAASALISSIMALIWLRVSEGREVSQ